MMNKKKRKKKEKKLWPCLEEIMVRGKMEFWESIGNLSRFNCH
jgi:hypothetical protein